MIKRHAEFASRLIFVVALAVSLLRLSAQGTCVSPPAGITSWWPANGNSYDLISTNNGTLVGGATFSAGEVGSAFSFDGTGAYVEVPDSPSLSFSSDFTVELWYRDDGIVNGTYGGLIAKRALSGPCNYGLSILGGNPGSLLVYFEDPIIGSYQGVTFQGVPAAGSFHHIAATFHQAAADQIDVAAYIDGQLVQTTTVPGNLARTTNNVPLDIGRSNQNGEYFKGEIDEVSIYNRLLSVSEITAIYQAGTAGKCLSIPPQVIVQPKNLTVTVGSTVIFSVEAIGAEPLSYQWTLDGANLKGETNSALTLTNVQLSQSGIYSVIITNSLGSIVSSNAVLTVNSGTGCLPPPSGLVSWWPAEGDPRDVVSSNNGVATNGVTFALGEVGQSFVFNGSNSYVAVPDSSSLSFSSDFSIELWYKDSGVANGTYGGLIAKRAISGPCNYGLSILGGNPGSLLAYFNDPTYGSYQGVTYEGVPPPGSFHHIAATFHQAGGNQIQVSAYIDGQLVQTVAVSGNLARTTNNVPVNIGRSNPNGEYFRGQIDEVSIYGRLLSGTEIASIYQAGSAGKCSSPIPANITQQPAAETTVIGQRATFTVGGAGTWPLSYQWAYNGASITGATNSSLVLTNVQMSQAGMYSVVVTNAYGSATSSNAALVVIFPPATVSISSTSGTAGGLVTAPVLLAANGNENALGFSVNFDPTLLTNVGVSLGAGARGASLVFNTNQAGKVGIGVALPSGTTFAAGTQEVADISFISTVSQTNFSTVLSFGDQPTKRVLVDATANTLLVDFVGGQVSFTRSAFEADVAPRPNGDGEVTVADWAQVGRFVAALDSPTNATEFQRADCAPRATLGDGLLTVSDWVQAGRYAAGLDPLTLAGGPTTPPTNLNNAVTWLVRPKGGQQRVVTAQGPVLFDGQTGTIAINLEAQGDENAVGLSLAFDPTVLTYVGTGYGADAINAAAMEINRNQASNGQLGIILALPSNVSFSPGPRQIIRVHFRAASAASVNSALALTDLPVRREVADVNALPVVTTYGNGIVAVNPIPSLAIGLASQNITLSWPLWGTDFILQSSTGSSLPATMWINVPVLPVITNNVLRVVLPVDTSPHFYRLQHQ